MARHGNMKSLEMAEKRVFDALLAILVFVCALPLFVVMFQFDIFSLSSRNV